ncbi:hypothetical protein PGT21_011662 [Puccinia graminis f. sp. tritici]|uniref:Mitochondrial outer membrane protein iml2 n=1 Tax=Puccinia graminis f. sp. tritici TaxID=56615 RepID=A0A5B0NTT7_PUCGR|nr:hypothetical protein PGTUg99_014373 [Puccinia graminis f. sp. tritici]KAA1099558.1 hypothetical protein PGT21_011662 [Puccinia graminis f. sp. tritici]
MKDSILNVSKAFDLLFHDDLNGARVLLQQQTQSDQPYHHVALALITFIEAVLSMEEQMIAKALESLLKSEEAVKQAKNALVSTGSTDSNQAIAQHWWIPGLEYDILLADLMIFQAILHFLAETISDGMKGIYKITKAYKIFSSSHQAVFSELQATNPISSLTSHADEEPGIEPFQATIQALYAKPKPHPSTLMGSSYFSGFSLSLYKRKKPGPGPSEGATPKYKAWTDDPIASLVIGGAAFGYGLFGLILSFLPPKVKKLLSWVGLNGPNTIDRTETILERNRCLRWLNFSHASCHWEMHGKLASLALLTYRSAMLKAVGWLAARDRSLQAYETLVDSLSHKTPTIEESEQGALWILHRSKLLVMKGQAEDAKRLISTRLHPTPHPNEPKNSSSLPPKFQHAVGLLYYEYALICVRLADWSSAGEAFLSMKKENAWSHVTYQFAALGCFLLVENRTEKLQKKIDDLFVELPNLFSKKKTLGREMPPHELLVTRKLAEYKAKHADLVLKGSIRTDRAECYWDSIQISPIEELGLLMAIYDESPKTTLISGIRRLSGLSPPVELDPKAIPADKTVDQVEKKEEDPGLSEEEKLSRLKLNDSRKQKDKEAAVISLSKEEQCMRDLLLAVQFLNLGQFDQSRQFLNNILRTNPSSSSTPQEPSQPDSLGGNMDYNYISAMICKALVELNELDRLLLAGSSAALSSADQPGQPPLDQNISIAEKLVDGKAPLNALTPHAKSADKDEQQRFVDLCFSKLRGADSILNSILELPESYPMRGRTESKIQLLKDEINEKIDSLNILFKLNPAK